MASLLLLLLISIVRKRAREVLKLKNVFTANNRELGRPEAYQMVTKSERISNKKLLEKTKTPMYCGLNVNRDGVRKEKLAKSSVRIKHVSTSEQNNS